MSKLKVYISSTYKDLKDFRALLIDFFDKEGCNHFEKLRIMEHMYDTGDSKPFLTTCIEEVEKCDLYIIILGQNAGSFPPDDTITYTQHEYLTAVAKKKKIFRFRFSGFNEAECDDITSYNNLKKEFAGKDVHSFKDMDDFQIKYLKAFFVLTDRYTASQALNINRANELSRFQLEAMNGNPNSCSLFIYNATSQDRPNYYNYRLKEFFNNKTNLEPKLFFIDMNLFAAIPMKENQILSHFAIKCLSILNIDAKLKNHLQDISEIKTSFYTILSDAGINDLVIPLKVTTMELRSNVFSANLINLLKKFYCGNEEECLGVRLHFVVCFEINELNDTVALYKDLKKEFNISDHVTLNNIEEYDIDRWIEYSDLAPNVQLNFKAKFLENLAKYNFTLPTKLQMIEVPLDETIKHFNS
jgi:hypothetical protein